MDSRTDKYFDDNTKMGSRVSKNRELYNKINSSSLDEYNINSNATVIGSNTKDMDVEKIKNILDTHYNDTPKRKSIVIDTLDEEPKRKEEEIKEYDINVILDKARGENKDVYDIPDDIKPINANDYIEDYDGEYHISSQAEAKLRELIDTVTLNEKMLREKQKELEEKNDLFAELKGDEDTEVLAPITKDEKDKNEINEVEVTEVDKSFFTESNKISKNDFEDDDEDEKHHGFAKFLIIVLILIFIAGIVILIKSVL